MQFPGEFRIQAWPCVSVTLDLGKLRRGWETWRVESKQQFFKKNKNKRTCPFLVKRIKQWLNQENEQVLFNSFKIIFDFIKYVCQFLLNKGKISLKNPSSRSHIFNRQNHYSDNHDYYTVIIYYMFISYVNRILTHQQSTLSLQEGSLLSGPSLCKAVSPAWTVSAFVLCSCTARAGPRLPSIYLPSLVCLVQTPRGPGDNGSWL